MHIKSPIGLFPIVFPFSNKCFFYCFNDHFGKQKKDLFDHVIKYGDLPLIEFKKEVMEKYNSLTDEEISHTVQKYLDGVNIKK